MIFKLVSPCLEIAAAAVFHWVVVFIGFEQVESGLACNRDIGVREVVFGSVELCDEEVVASELGFEFLELRLAVFAVAAPGCLEEHERVPAPDLGFEVTAN